MLRNGSWLFPIIGGRALIKYGASHHPTPPRAPYEGGGRGGQTGCRGAGRRLGVAGDYSG
ncbi:hypothetical protein GCM10009125_11820 [Castellaniella daejeonensis]|uniref:Uncharacterized protein n=1 Tax=Castellaniella daejeonensis TaxID=659013 RepID=A0ABN0TL70_9BURK